MRSTLLAVAVSLAVVCTAVPASATAGTLAGFGQVTAHASCPSQFKIPIEAVETAGSWTFTIAGVHASCFVTLGMPVSFRGSWNPVQPGCDALTGIGCPVSMDPARPGFFALGAVPRVRVLDITSLRFCLSGKCWEGAALVERLS